MKANTEFEAAELVRATLIEKGYKAFLVGGCVRDLLIQREPNDWDVTTDATPDEVEGCFTHTVPVGKAFGVVIVLVSNSTAVDFQIEVATFRTDGQYSDGRRPDSVAYSKEAREDVIRRDFTINGLLMDTLSEPMLNAKAVAHFDTLAQAVLKRGGMVELISSGELHHSGALAIDYVGGLADLKAQKIRCIGNPLDRFRDDAMRMLRAVRFAAQLGFEIEQETQGAIEALASTITRVSKERVAAELFKLVTARYPTEGLVPLVLTGLMEYVVPSFGSATLRRFAKFQTTDPLKGMAMLLAEQDYEVVCAFCDELKLTNHQKDVIKGALNDDKMALLDYLTLAELKKLARRPGIQIALDLFEQDVALGRDVVTPEYAEAIRKLRNFTPEEIRPTPLVTGDDLIAMGLKPGPLFTKLLGAVEEGQLNGTLLNRDTAKELVFSMALNDKLSKIEKGLNVS